MGYYSQQGVIFTISGASPTPTEQARIDDYLSKLPQPAPPPLTLLRPRQSNLA